MFRAFNSVKASLARLGVVLPGWLHKMPSLARRLERVAWSRCPEVSGNIESISVASLERRWQPHLGCVVYNYQVNDQNYSGVFTKAFPSNQEAWEFVAERRAKPVSVRYRPENPAESYLFDRPSHREEQKVA